MLKVKNIKKIFLSGDVKIAAINGISFELEQGNFVSIVGRSGSGKSTMLSLLGGLEKPTSGEIEVDGKDIAKMSDHDLIYYRSKAIGFVFQSYNLVPNLTAMENVMLPMETTKMSKNDRKKRAQKLLNQVGLKTDKQLRKPSRLSGGEQQRVAIARALANKPKIILADEPTGNLDSQTGEIIFKLLRDLSRSESTTIIVVTHDLEIAGQTDRVLKLKDGKIEG
jgi:putative ABC transport system ATP-binding protein